ncbi:MAG: lysophospholipid acyltransferase family protein [Planctomycetaceae bacterium]|nr:lysophospholipid acyltransferase family protein [Planctomycetaceae bacterium]
MNALTIEKPPASTSQGHPRSIELPRVSPAIWRVFSSYVTRYLRKQFHGVRVLRTGAFPQVAGEPLAIYLNHPSWWDPLVCICLARNYLNDRTSYGPFDSEALARYRILERIGCFGVEQGSLRGTIRFLQIGGEILRRPLTALWITAQGEFVDPRSRPVALRAGLGHLAARAERGAFVPLAIEYVFWTERSPEVLLSFGEPLRAGSEALPCGDTRACSEALAARLERTQDQLAQAAQRRDPAEFTTVLSGRVGVNWFYDTWRRGWATLRGRAFQLEHGACER